MGRHGKSWIGGVCFSENGDMLEYSGTDKDENEARLILSTLKALQMACWRYTLRRVIGLYGCS